MGAGKTYKSDLRELLQEFVKNSLKSEKIYSDIGHVLSVDEVEKTCVVDIINGPEIEGVRLQQLSGDSGFLAVPTINSLVVVSYTDRTTAYVSMFSYIDSVIYQGGSNGGLTITPELVTNLDKLTARVDKIIDAISNGVPVAGDGGIAYQTTMKAILATIVGKEDFSNIENVNFKH